MVRAYLIFKNNSTDFDRNFKLILEISVKFREQFETRLKIYHVLYPIHYRRSFNVWRISSHKARYNDFIEIWGKYFMASNKLCYTNLTTFYLFYYKNIKSTYSHISQVHYHGHIIHKVEQLKHYTRLNFYFYLNTTTFSEMDPLNNDWK